MVATDINNGQLSHERNPMMKLLRNFLILLYLALFIYIVFFARRRWNIHLRTVNLVPFKGSIRDYLDLDRTDDDEVRNFFVQLFGNIALFIPMPFVLLGWFKLTKGASLVGFCFLISVGIECIQYVFRAGVSDVDDLILNTIGAGLGCIFIEVHSRWKALRMLKKKQLLLAEAARKMKKVAKNRKKKR